MTPQAGFKGAANRVSANLAAKSQGPKDPPTPQGGVAKGKESTGFLEQAGKAIGFLVELEKKISPSLNVMPYAAQPAAREFDMHAGYPHGHMHKPTFGAPLPSLGPLIPLPYVSGAEKVKINDQVAMRCGDFGVSAWCGGYMPMNEVYLGSASVWIESARAARKGDLTNHCILFDPPMSVIAVGQVLNGSANVIIGGAPLPSMTQLAIGAALKKVVGKAHSVGKKGYRRAQPFFKAVAKKVSVEQRTLQRFLRHVEILGPKGFRELVIDDLHKLVATKTGRKALNEAVDNGQRLRIKPTSALADPSDIPYPKHYPGWTKEAIAGGRGPSVWADDVSDWGKTKPVGSTVYYDPKVTNTIPDKIGHLPSDSALVHELSHANNMGKGKFNDTPFPQREEYGRMKNLDEKQAVATENAYRAETGQPKRDRYWYPPKHDPYWGSR